MEADKTTVAALLTASLDLEKAGQVDAGLRHAEEAHRKVVEHGSDSALLAAATARLAYFRFRLGRYEEAATLASRALSLSPVESVARVEALTILGGMSAETNSPDRAEDYLLQAAEMARRLGLDSERGRALHNLAACVYLVRGQFDLALAADREALRLADGRSDRAAAVYPLITLVWAHWLRGDGEEARRHCLRLRRLAPPDTTMEGWYYFLRAELASDDGRPRRAETAFGRARAVAERSGDPGLSICVRLGMNRLRATAGRWGAALEWAEDAHSHAARLGYEHYRGLSLLARAQARHQTGEVRGGDDDLRRAVVIFESLQAHYDLAVARIRWADRLRALDDPEAGAAWAEAIRTVAARGYWVLLSRERPAVLRLAAYFQAPGDEPASAASQAALANLAQSAPPLLVRMLGGFSVCLGSGSRPVDPAALRQRRCGELLALLLLSPNRTLRLETAAEALWPDRDPRSRALLHHATSHLKRALERDLPDRFPSGYVQVLDGTITLHLPPGSELDVETLEQHVSCERWRQALHLCRGELLAEWPDADWARAARERAHDLQVRALAGRAAECRRAGDCAEALRCARRLLVLDPWNESAAVESMATALALGDRATALKIYAALEQALRLDLNLSPGPELQELRDRARAT